MAGAWQRKEGKSPSEVQPKLKTQIQGSIKLLRSGSAK